MSLRSRLCAYGFDREADRRARLLVFLPWFFWVVLAGCNGASGTDGSRTSPDQSGDASPGSVDGGRGGSGGTKPQPSASATAMPSSVPGACLPALARCDGEGLSCCAGSLCLAEDGVKRCVQTCSSRFDCGSLCCLEDKTANRKVCAAADACPPLPCSEVAGPCEQPGPSCCTALVCVSSTSSDYAGCRKPCGGPSDCDTGCCVPYADGKLGFCGAASLCGCAAADSACGGTRHCCDGLVCTTVDTPGAFACRPSCKTKADCATGCCLGITGTAGSACMPSNWCPK
jgi:hypothetical protein